MRTPEAECNEGSRVACPLPGLTFCRQVVEDPALMLRGFVLSRVAQYPPDLHLRPDARVLAFAVSMAVLAAIAFGLAPALTLH